MYLIFHYFSVTAFVKPTRYPDVRLLLVIKTSILPRPLKLQYERLKLMQRIIVTVVVRQEAAA